MKKIAIIEDDISINHGIALALKNEEYEFYSYYQLKDAVNLEQMDLVILDVNLPDGSGYDLLKRLRKISHVPVLILTANDTELDEVTGLELGADDFVAKPFRLMALRLRVEKLLDRQKKRQVYEYGSLYLDFDSMLFRRAGQEVELSKTEIRLLRLLVCNAGQTIPRERMLEYVWQNQEFVEENALSVSVKRLRDKLESEHEKYIYTVYGIGYVWKWEDGTCV